VAAGQSQRRADGLTLYRFVLAGLAAGSAVHEAVGAQTHVELGLAEHAKFFAPATRFRPLALGADDSAYAWFRRHDLEFSGVEVGKERNGSHRRAGLRCQVSGPRKSKPALRLPVSLLGFPET